ncbi:MAG TPA: TadE/TadG family type IV pilus assembly protein [Candidatus Goldiibacteriota bacterium]|nr:TadE/TadG family type IV pilus assembly protein [Candidatus Goldiibacteriota bacterium]
MIKNKKTQAVTEFVLILPVVLLLFFGVYQFGLLALTKIKLAMVEREVMRFITDEEDRKGDVEKFTGEIAEKTGLDKNNLKISNKDSETKTEDNGNEKFSLSNMGPLSSFTGIEFVLTYEQDFIPVLAVITGKKSVKIQTKLVTASGGNFVFKIKESLKSAGEEIKRILFPDNKMDKYVKTDGKE